MHGRPLKSQLDWLMVMQRGRREYCRRVHVVGMLSLRIFVYESGKTLE